jgi:hypothetical protein
VNYYIDYQVAVDYSYANRPALTGGTSGYKLSFELEPPVVE